MAINTLPIVHEFQCDVCERWRPAHLIRDFHHASTHLLVCTDQLECEETVQIAKINAIQVEELNNNRKVTFHG